MYAHKFSLIFKNPRHKRWLRKYDAQPERGCLTRFSSVLCLGDLAFEIASQARLLAKLALGVVVKKEKDVVVVVQTHTRRRRRETLRQEGQTNECEKV